jgi:TRAP-type C4-dicarboxylate transport system substrate-binding protein
VQQRFYEVAHHMARTRHIAGVIGLFASSRSLARLPADVRTALERAALDASAAQRGVGPREDAAATAELANLGMSIREIDARAFREPATQLWEREARALDALPWLDAIRA